MIKLVALIFTTELNSLQLLYKHFLKVLNEAYIINYSNIFISILSTFHTFKTKRERKPSKNGKLNLTFFFYQFIMIFNAKLVRKFSDGSRIF
jgi:hypothetical protein